MYPTDIDGWPEIMYCGSNFKESLLNMANAITKLELWDWLKVFTPEDDEGFMFCKNLNISKIENMVSSDGHSGASFAIAMRCMECIAKEGFDHFKEIKNN